MAFDIGSGISMMGKSISDTAASEGLEMQKASLEEDKERLADQLATTRESAGRVQQEGLSEQLAAKTSALAVGASKEEEENKQQALLEYAPKIADMQRQITIANGRNDPENIKALEALAEADPEEAGLDLRAHAGGLRRRNSTCRSPKETEQAHQNLSNALRQQRSRMRSGRQ